MSHGYRVLLYYKFQKIDDPALFADTQLKFCRRQSIRGRILVAREGINGTVSGTRESTELYMDFLRSQNGFKDVDFKIDHSDEHVFDKLFVRVRSEIVTLAVDGLDPRHSTGIALDPPAFRNLMRRPDTVVLDIRNDYEYELGHFKGALRPNVKAFKDFPAWIERTFGKNKHVPLLTYCTGGIRCEKLTGYLLDQGFERVYQLKGGIVNYGKDPETLGVDFDGRCYVFDKRISVEVNTVNPSIVARCLHCGLPCERYLNCAHLDCHRRFFCCPNCEREMLRSCSVACRGAAHRESLTFQSI